MDGNACRGCSLCGRWGKGCVWGGGRGRGVTTGMAKLRAGDRVYEYVLASEWA